ncbi:MAG: serine protease [Acholeplasmataceae bacterium]|nr:serine protease [Acholeplasmataceae bacterium]
MKKLSLIVMFFGLIITISGCSILSVEEDTFEFRQLSDQYNEYVINDVVNFDDFRNLMNQASNVSSTSVFMIETDVLDVFNRVTNTYHGTGTIFFEDSNYFYVLTTYQIIDLVSRRVHYFVTDAYGQKMPAEIFAADSILGLGILRVDLNSTDYEIAEFASYIPLTDELVLMISNSYPTQNIQKLGRFLYQDDTPYMEVTSSQNANGSPIYNLKLEVIGIQYLYGDTYVQMIDFNTIDDFIRPLLPI